MCSTYIYYLGSRLNIFINKYNARILGTRFGNIFHES